MMSRARPVVAPAYLAACLVLGGSVQAIVGNMFLQVAGVAIIAWAAVDGTDEPVSAPARQLLLLAGAALLLIAIQLVPLPASVWSHAGGRGVIADGFRTLGMELPAEPLSTTPAASLSALLAIIPPLAIFCAMARLRAYRPQWLAIALVICVLAAIALGSLQIASYDGNSSHWYLYQDTSSGKAVGFSANADHMASLLVLTIPFLAAIIAAARTSNVQRRSAILAVAIGVGLLVIIGLALNGSLAGYALALPVIAASAVLVLPPASRLRIWIVAIAVALVVVAVVAIETTAIGSATIGEHATASVDSRAQLATLTGRAALDYMPFGSGLGSFPSVYQLYENAQQVTTTYVVHAHNDYLEVALELGIGGIILMLLFLVWWAKAVWQAWRTAEPRPFVRAASIASASVLIHSAVDFPLRTASIAACFGMCLALLAESRAAAPKEKAALRRKRHAEFK